MQGRPSEYAGLNELDLDAAEAQLLLKAEWHFLHRELRSRRETGPDTPSSCRDSAVSYRSVDQ